MLGALAMFLVGGMAVAIRRQQTSLRTVEAYHRALDTMGRLAAQQAGGPQPTTSTDPDHPYVRVVRDEAGAANPPKAPLLRSRPHRSRTPASTGEDPTPIPATTALHPEANRDPPAGRRTPPPAPAGWSDPPRLDALSLDPLSLDPSGLDPLRLPAPIPDRPGVPPPAPAGFPTASPHRTLPEVASPPTLCFDAGADERPIVGDPAAWPELPPRPPAATSHGAAPGRSRWRGVTGLVAVVVLAAGGVTAGLVVADRGGQGTGPTSPARGRVPATAPRLPASSPAPVATPLGGADLVSSTAGASTYRIGPSATVAVQANGTCWVEIRQSTPQGAVLFEGSILAGQSRAVSGPAWVRLGNPTSVAITVDGTSISPPGIVSGEPYDLQFA